MVKGFLSFLLLTTFFIASAQYKDNSVLANGDWYKLGVIKDGIYKIDYAYLKQMGINPDKIDPNKIQIYGNGGGMLPQANSISRIDDLAECPLYTSGIADGKFDKSDFILFYAQGPDEWIYNSSNTQFTHSKNLYSDTAYYFITVNQNNAKQVPQISSEIAQNSAIQTYDEHLFHENDLINLIKSGREWYGEQFDGTNSQSFSFNTPGMVAGNNIKINVAVMVKPLYPTQTFFTVNLNGLGLSTLRSNICDCSDLGYHGIDTYATYDVNTLNNTENLTLTLNHNRSADIGAIGYLNYIEALFNRNLSLYGSQTIFRSIASASQSVASFTIVNTTSNTLVWDITDIHDIKSIQYSGSNSASFSVKTDSSLREFVVFEPSLINQSPFFTGKISNQNLHQINDAELLILTHPSLMEQANRLADFRNANGVKAKVVNVDQAYNEFSSGAQDISAIRDLCRLMWKQGNLKHVLFFGACSYDYKNRINNNSNLVPVYETRESLHTINSYCSSDYFGLLGVNQGEWPENSVDTSKMTIGIGRLPVSNTAEAKIVVDKLIHYSSERPTLGKWRNKVSFLADNGDGNSHLDNANDLADDLDTSDKKLNINKIYLDAYPLVSTPAGNTSPETNQAILDAINQGALLINYSGHGGPKQIAQEAIMNTGDIPTWGNFDKLPFFVTATCDFGVYDDPETASGGIVLLNSEKSGGIGVITAGRPVFQNTNYALNLAFYQYAFKADSNGKMPTLGDIFRQTKNNSIKGITNKGYSLLGDPSLTLNYPKYNIVVTSLNTGNSSSTQDTLKALSIISIEGEVREGKGNTLVSDFNGTLFSDVYDKYSMISTLGQVPGTDPVTFKLRNNTIQSGQSSVSNGKFSFSFVVPKDINYEYDKGKISLYASRDNSMEDAGGFNLDLIVGGTNPNAPQDNTPPVINLYLDDTTFINGGYTSSSPTLIARLSDENGINIARSGIGHEVSGKISTDPTKTLVLNDFYISDLNTYKKGTVSYKLNSLPEGTHTFTLKAWDTYNNSSEATVNFIVPGANKLVIQQLSNVPNPFTIDLSTKFQIQHNRAGEDLQLNLTIYSVDGRIIKEFNEDIIVSNATILITWDTFTSGYNILPGMYVYTCTLRSKKDGTSDKAFQKLVLIH